MNTTARPASSSIRLCLLADRTFARRTPRMPAEVLAVATEPVRLVFHDVASRVEEAVHALGDGRAIALKPFVGFREGFGCPVALVPLHVMDQRDRTEAGMKLRHDRAEPFGERIGSNSVVDLREVLKTVFVEDFSVFEFVLLGEVVQFKDFICVAHKAPP